jgi:hypothetical protein
MFRVLLNAYTRHLSGFGTADYALFFIIIIIYLFTAIGFAPGGSSPTLVQTKTIKQHYTVVQHNTIKRKQHNTIVASATMAD